uniref:G-protein coupled receptors family 1 profile domain-containing protein n=1 Tax=Esox lucius TaxID=8010 RepID=A0AAY5KV55_ESOLU
MNQFSGGRGNETDGAEVMRVMVPVLDSLILVTGMLGHSLAISIVTGRRRTQGSRVLHGTDVLLLALGAADLLLLLCLPFHTAAIALGSWPFGTFLCKAISFLGAACSAASVFTLAALAVTRYLAVVHPTWSYRAFVRRHLKLTAALLWIPAAALAAPQFAVRVVAESGSLQCFAILGNLDQLVYSAALFLFAFAVPLGVIVVMYARIYCFLRQMRRLGHAPQLERYQSQVTHTSALLVLVFTLCWLPSYCLMFSLLGRDTKTSPRCRYVAIFIRLMASSASAVNPVLYVLMSNRFRGDLEGLGRECWEAFRGCVEGCRWVVLGGDMVQPFNPAEVDTPPLHLPGF